MSSRVLIASHLYPSPARPLNAPWLREQVAALAALGVDVEVLCCSPYEPANVTVLDGPEGVPVHYRNTSAGPLNGTRAGLIFSAVRQWLAMKKFLAEKGADFDVIHAHFAFPDAAVAIDLGRRTGKPVVVTVHGSDVRNLLSRRDWFGSELRRALSEARMVIAVSTSLAAEVRSLLAPGTSMRAIENGFDDRVFRVEPVEPDLGYLFVGSLRAVKNVEALVSLYLENEELHGLPLTIVGTGPLEERLKAMATASPAADRVAFLGELSREEVADSMRRASALVVPSVSEGYGVVAAEALACGTPVVGSRVGGIEDILAAEAAGILVEPGDDEALSEALRRIRDWPHSAEEVAKASGARPWSVRAEEIADVYREVLSSHRSEGPARQMPAGFTKSESEHEDAATRIAYLTLQATTQGQAAHAHVHEIVNGLQSRGWAVDLWEPSYPAGSATGWLERLATFRRLQHFLAKELRAGHYDALYVRGHPLAWPSARVARNNGVPVVQECNGPYDDFYAVWPKARWFAPALEYLALSQFSAATQRIAVTPELAEWLQRETGHAATVIGNGANVSLFRPDAATTLELPERYAVFIGALSPWQGVDLMLSAAADPQWPEGVSLVVAGDGLLREKVDQAAEKGVVVPLGSIPYDEVPGVIAGSVCSLVLSRREGDWGLSPLKLYESMACGVPVIVPDVSGTASTVREHECGLVTESDEPVAVARAVTRLMEDQKEADAMGSRGREAASALYSWGARANATAGVIERALG